MEIQLVQSTILEAAYLVKRAQERAMTGDHTTAINYLEKAVDMHPGCTEAYHLLGNCHECLDRNDDAVEYYDKVLTLDPGHADAWFNKGMSLKKLGKHKEAAQCIEKSIDLYCGR